MATRRKYDIVVFGATGFTGGLTAEYLAKHAPASLRWALAGRNLDKLKTVRARIGDVNPAWQEIDLLSADIGDADSIRQVAEATKVVITTVGPYIRYGEPLVAACAAAGTDYVDLTGEPEFVDAMWLRYHDIAKANGARIVNCCGFDSIPHDLGAFFTVKHLPEDVPLKVEGFVRAGGTFSGGTLHSAVTAFSRIGEYSQVRRQRRQREDYPLERKIGSTRQTIRFVKEFGAWAVPMPTIDPQIVRRTAVANDRYGPNFRYGHYVLVKKLSRVAMLLGGVSALFAGAQLKITRDRILKLKDQGGNKRVVTEVSGGDPGYGETSKMLAESALCLAFDRLPRKGGVITPGQAMGDALIERLQAAGMQFRVIS
jgi:short subunit dehydrogenase-like uncharacterized protein